MIRKLFGNPDFRINNKNHIGSRLLWLTDTYDDHNGVSIVLQSMHQEIKKRNLPIDILVTSSTLIPDDHLLVVKPLIEFTLSFYQHQPIRIPNYLEVRRVFKDRRYDRIICSTEGPMGMAALYLKRMFSVKTFFFLHTDWIMFAKAVMKMENTGLNQVRRLLRYYYKRYDGLFVLNTEQQHWLSGKEMRINPAHIFLTAHWVDQIFRPVNDSRNKIFEIPHSSPVLLFAGRLSQEKGVLELPVLFQKVKEKIPDLTLVIAGTGPAEQKLKQEIPGAIFLGWVNHNDLPRIYSSADLLVLPSRFDTFSCVVLEAISCGLPVLAYDTKGPKDILQNFISGFLVNDSVEMSECAISYFSDPLIQNRMKQSALKRAQAYVPETILDHFISDVGLRNAC